MAYKIKLNYDNIYDLKDGFIYKDELNETLDSSTVQFKVYGDELDCVSFDTAEIYDSESAIENKRLLVDSCDDEIYSFDDTNGDDHTYTMLLFSQTKELERITLPNCSVTQPLKGTKKTVWDEIQRFLAVYMPSIRLYDEDSRFYWSYKYSVDSLVQEKFENIQCPEFQWNNPTLREVLSDLFYTADCIPVIKNNYLSLIDLSNYTNTSQEINTSFLNYSKKSFGSSDYVGELTIDMKNAIGKGKTIVCEKKSLRSSGASFSTENAVFETQHPIYNIISCKVSYYYLDSRLEAFRPHVRYHKEIDITDFVVEDDVFEIANSGRYTGNDVNVAKGYKHYLLHYKRGEKNIDGWGDLQKSGPNLWDVDVPTIGWIAEILGEAETTSYPVNYGSCFLGRDRNDTQQLAGIAVDLTYETVNEHSMHVGKYLPVRHPTNRMFDNQSSSYVDVNSQSIFEYAKVNRLGNKIREIRGTYFNESDLPNLGDHLGNEILFSREIHYHDEIIEFIGFLTPNYVLRNYFTGVQAKRRSWQLAKDDEALTRTQIIKRYLEFSFDKKTDFVYSDTTTHLSYFVDALNSRSPESTHKFNYVLINAIDSSYNLYPESGYLYQLDLDVAVQGMSLCFNFGLTDNVSVDSYVTYDSEQDIYIDNLYRYCDNKGDVDDFGIYFVNYIDPSDEDFVWDSNHQDYEPNEMSAADVAIGNVFGKVTQKPKIKRSPLSILSSSLNEVHKDNREIMAFAYQYEYCSETADIIVTQKLIQFCTAFSTNALSNKLYASTSETFDLSNKTIKSSHEYISAPHCTLVEVDSSVSIVLNDALPAGTKSWCITDNNDNIILAVNGNRTTLWVNQLLDRDDRIYYSLEDQYPIGTLKSTQAQLDAAYSAHTPSVQLGNLRVGRRLVNRNNKIVLEKLVSTAEDFEDMIEDMNNE